MRSKRFLTTATAGALAVALASCAQPSASDNQSGEGEPITITVATGYPEAVPDNQALIAYGDAIEEATDGRITFEYYFAGSLHPLAETSEALADGLVDLTFFVPLADSQAARFPITVWASELALLNDPSMPAGYLAGTAAQSQWAAEQPELIAEMESAGIQIATSLLTHPRYDLLCTKPIQTLADAQGTRVRVPGGVWLKQVEALGMVPVALSGSESYEGLQRGIVDCVAGQPDGYVTNSWREVANEYTPISLIGYSAYYLAFGKDFWDSLNETDQTILAGNVDVFLNQFYGPEGAPMTYRQFFDEADEYGIQVNQPDDELVSELEDANAGFIADLAATAPSQMPDPDAGVAAYAALNEKWLDQALSLQFAEHESYEDWAEQQGTEDSPDTSPFFAELMTDSVIPTLIE